MSVMESAADVLRLLARKSPELAFADVVRDLALPKSTASRLLSQMSGLGFLERDPLTRRFRPGLLILEAARGYRSAGAVGRLAHEALSALSAQTGYTGYLTVLDGTDTVVLQRFNGTHPLQIVSPPGTRRPAFMTAMGRVLLSRLPEAELRERYGRRPQARLSGALSNGPRTVGDLFGRVAKARAERSATVIDDGLPGVAAVASSLCDPATGETAGLCLTFPSTLVTRAQMRKAAEMLIARTRALGQRIGDPLWQT